MLVLSRADVEGLLDLDRLRGAVAAAMADLSAGRVSMPPRIAAIVSDRDALLAAMPAYLPSSGALATKLVSLFPRNTDRPTHQAVIVVFDANNGSALALMDGEAITAARTAAGSALSTDLLARKNAKSLVIVGSGVQAHAHLRAVSRVRQFETIAVAARQPEKAEALAWEFQRETGRRVGWHDTIELGVSAADVVCACTHSAEPVVRREWLEPGTHVTSVGYNTAGREVDGATFRDALVVVESRAATLAPPPAGSNDIAMAIAEGSMTREHVYAEIGELVSGAKPGRADATQITLYKSVGVAAQDAAAAAMVLENARKAGVGRTIEL